MLFLDKNKKIILGDDEFLKKEKNFWNHYGKVYRHLEVGDPYKKMLDSIRNILLNNKKYKSKWLDIGCGPGTIIDLILNSISNVKKIIGIDFDNVMLSQASRRLVSFNNVKIKKMDLSNGLLFSDNYFDGITSNLVLPYISSYKNKYVGVDALREVLKEIYRVLNYNGILIWTSPVENVNFFKVFLASWKEVFNPLTPKYVIYGPVVLSYALQIQRKGKLGIYHFLNKEEISILMKNIGFKNIKIKKVFANQSYLISANKE